MKLHIKKFAELTGVTVRTLHYYHKIRLLEPDFTDRQTGYRFYGEAALQRMQEILFYRELDFSLKEISELLSSPAYNKTEALLKQKQLLLLKKERLENIIAALEAAEKGETMDLKAFDNGEFERQRKAYQQEAKVRWGNTKAFAESEEKTAGFSAQQWNDLAAEMNAILEGFSAMQASGELPDSLTAAKLVKKLQEFITQTQYRCTDEILRSLGEMYVTDQRFTQNIDQHGVGTAAFISKAIAAYCTSKNV